MGLLVRRWRREEEEEEEERPLRSRHSIPNSPYPPPTRHPPRISGDEEGEGGDRIRHIEEEEEAGPPTETEEEVVW